MPERFGRSTELALGLLCIGALGACTFSARDYTLPNSNELRIGVTQGSSGGDTSSGLTALAGLISYEGLTTIGKDGRPLPRVIQSYDRADGGLTWTFTLRPNATFHDGSPVTPADVRDYILNKTGSLPGLQNVLAVTITEPNKVTTRLRSASSMFLEDLYEPITKDVGGRRIGTGPFQLVSQSTDEAVLVAYPNYYGGVPRINRLVIKAYPAFRQTYVSLLREDIDAIYDVGHDAVEFLREQSSIQLYPYTRPYAFTVAFNNGLLKFRDARVRQALNMAINRRSLIDTALRGHGEEAGTSVWVHHWAFDGRYPGFTYDPGRASALFAAAGLNGHPRLRFTCLVPAGLDPYERTALVLQRQLADFDVDLQLEQVPYAEAMKRIANGDFEALLSDMAGGPGMNVQYRFWHSPSPAAPWNMWNYRSVRTDAALDDIATAIDEPEYRRAMSLLQRAIMEEPPAIFLTWREASRAMSRRFEVFAQPRQDIRETLRLWQPVSGDRRRTN